MGTKDRRVDDYIKNAAPFAQPILKYLRKVVHAGCPEVEETIKWQFPHFDYKGVLCGMAAFKEHCAFGFWKGELIVDSKHRDGSGMGQFGRITSRADLPDEKTLVAYVRKAAELNAQGIKVPGRSKPTKRAALPVPAYMAAALKANAKAEKTFNNLSASQRREYVEWVTEAKRDETRQQRLTTAIEWMAEGKARNWKYAPARR
jgi:uncharacterized protein YdeI (YjbR/CyaY-like superfamily)